MKFVIFSFIFSVLVFHSEALKILGFLPFDSKSHFAIGHAVIKSLHEAGHEVTVVSPFPKKKPIERYRDISTADIVEKFKKEQEEFKPFDFGNIHPAVVLPIMGKMGNDIVAMHMEHPIITDFLKSNEKFDICVLEIFAIDAFVGVAEHFGCILIGYTTFASVKWSNALTSNEMPASYIAHPFLDFTDQMTFTQRLENTAMSLYEDFMYSVFHIPNQRRLYNKYFPNAKRSFDEMQGNYSIIFLNTHVSSSSPRPYLNNMIEMGGIHVEPKKPLPEDIQKFLDSATEGVILFSMGSIIQAVDWPEDKREAFVKAFRKLNYKVLWKYENDTLPNKPNNVMIGKWIPQRDIVAHPNVKLFITHGGLLGTTEALVEGKPILGIPVFGDQKMNMKKAVSRGYAGLLPVEEISEQKLDEVLRELLQNPKYRKNAEEISKRFQDRPISPKDSVVYWTEYAYRHKGAPHLRAAANDLNFIEFNLIDVYIVIAIFWIVVLYIDYRVLKFVIRKVCKRSKKLKTK